MKKLHGLVYLASPYSHDRTAVRAERFYEVCKCAAAFMVQGVNIFSPIAHTHPIAMYDLPKGFDFWGPYDRLYLGFCSCIIVAKLDGWAESNGVGEEIRIMMHEQRKPVYYIDAPRGTMTNMDQWHAEVKKFLGSL